MKVLSIRQPWAIIYAAKDIENRSWKPKTLRGMFAVHASLRSDDLQLLPRGVRKPKPEHLLYEAIIAFDDLIGVVERSSSLLRLARPIFPRKARIDKVCRPTVHAPREHVPCLLSLLRLPSLSGCRAA